MGYYNLTWLVTLGCTDGYSMLSYVTEYDKLLDERDRLSCAVSHQQNYIQALQLHYHQWAQNILQNNIIQKKGTSFLQSHLFTFLPVIFYNLR